MLSKKAQAITRRAETRVEPLCAEGLLDSPRLAAIQFGFAPRDVIPPWFVHTLTAFGGIALGAFRGDQLVGYSYATPGFDGSETFLLACGLAVDPGIESSGVGEQLKLAQREHARAAGFATIRWTTASLASRQLYLYLTKLGARLVRYHEDFYAATQGVVFPDEVEVVWPVEPVECLRVAGPAPTITSTIPIEDGRRRLVAVDLEGVVAAEAEAFAVEIPWDRHAVADDPDLAPPWRTGVRMAMRHLLDAGYEGTRVDLDRSERRTYVRFERRQQPATNPLDGALIAPERAPDASIAAMPGCDSSNR